jgi:predicted ATPase
LASFDRAEGHDEDDAEMLEYRDLSDGAMRFLLLAVVRP